MRRLEVVPPTRLVRVDGPPPNRSSSNCEGRPAGRPSSFREGAGAAQPRVVCGRLFLQPRYVRVLARFAPLLNVVTIRTVKRVFFAGRVSDTLLMLRPRRRTRRLPSTYTATPTTRAP